MTDPVVLDPAEQRVLGSLLEKEATVPASYPLSLNSLRTACNQSTSREPLTDYGEDELQAVTLRLQERRLVRLVRQHGGRTVKYASRLCEALGVEGPERALLTVLLLRGPQAAGELKTRTERLHPFGDRADVELADRGHHFFGDPADRLVGLLVDVGHGRVGQVIDRSVVVPLAQVAHQRDPSGRVMLARDRSTSTSSRFASSRVSAAEGS